MATAQDKLLALERARDLFAAGELKALDVVVLVDLVSSIDRESGVAIRRYQTVAESCGRDRSSVVRSVARLRATGLIERQQRRYKRTRGKTASAFSLADLGAERHLPRCKNAPSVGAQRAEPDLSPDGVGDFRPVARQGSQAEPARKPDRRQRELLLPFPDLLTTIVSELLKRSGSEFKGFNSPRDQAELFISNLVKQRGEDAVRSAWAEAM